MSNVDQVKENNTRSPEAARSEQNGCGLAARPSVSPGKKGKSYSSVPTKLFTLGGGTSPPNGVSANGTGNGITKNLSHLGAQAKYQPLTEKIAEHINSGEPFFSLEFFPPRTLNGVSNLIGRLDKMGSGGPLFVDITWHVGGEPNSERETSSSSIAGAALNYCLLETMLHLTCCSYTKEQTLNHLQRAKDLGLRNILALRGDVDPDFDSPQELPYAVDLVRLIREEYGSYFVICVAGYPTGHPDAKSYRDDLNHLKAKVEAGADFIITQLFFRVDRFFQFVKDCREIGIHVPIIPGVMPIQSYDSLRHIAKLSKMEIPSFILDAIEPIKQNDEAVRNYGISLGIEMCTELVNSGVPGVHLYTLNREVASREILPALGMWKTGNYRILPWKPPVAHHKRCKEDVRPIFWSVRPKSYLYRTQDWDDFPNGRWGNSSSPAFGDLKDYYLFHLQGKKSTPQNLMDMWGHEVGSEEDVWDVFHAFVTGKDNQNGQKVHALPWSEDESLAPESSLLDDLLAWCNARGVLTINSQPSVNAAPSEDPVLGWGAPGGFVYQKAYLEFFTSQKNVNALLSVLPKFPTVNYHIINHDGSIDLNNSNGNTTIAVTWGVFPGTEIQQPTVVDPISFHAWKTEAFDAWLSVWAKLYPEGCKSRQVLQGIHDGYCLVNLVDNNFIGDPCLKPLLEAMLRAAGGEIGDSIFY